jgi:hypothetical protein
MASRIPGTQVRFLTAGIKVDRATAVLPATAYGALFTVAGGRVLVTGLVGEFTVVASGTATTVKVTGTPTTGTAVDWTSATAVTSKEVGSQMTLPAASGGALVVQNGGAGGQVQVAAPYVAAIGTLGITTSATNTGSAKWSITYVPLDDGASVTAV